MIISTHLLDITALISETAEHGCSFIHFHAKPARLSYVIFISSSS